MLITNAKYYVETELEGCFPESLFPKAMAVRHEDGKTYVLDKLDPRLTTVERKTFAELAIQLNRMRAGQRADALGQLVTVRQLKKYGK